MNTVKTWRQMDTLKCPIFFISSHTIISHTRDAACILYFRGRRRLPVSNRCGQAEEGLGGGLLHPHLLAPQIPQSTQFHLSHLQKSHLQVWFTEGCFHRVILKYPNPAQTGKIALSLTFYALCPHLLSTLTTLRISIFHLSHLGSETSYLIPSRETNNSISLRPSKIKIGISISRFSLA